MSPTARAGRAGSRGFTLLELMLATLLLVSGVAACAFFMSRGIFATTGVENMQQGIGLTQERLEQIRGTPFSSIVSEPKAPISGWPGFSRQVAVTQPSRTNGDFKQVIVTVTWETTGGELSTSLTTYVANIANN